MKSKLIAVLTIAATLYSCDDETVGIGQFIADNELIPSKAITYSVETKSILLDSVFSRSSTAYLGKFTDKEYGTFSSDFLVQINCPEDFELPDNIESITKAQLGLYYTNYFGDSLATLHLQVDTLARAIKDDGINKHLYYSNLDPEKEGFYNSSVPPIAIKDYSAYDKTVSDSLHNTEDYYPRIFIDLGDDFCNYFLKKYNYTEQQNGKTIHPYFNDAETFINNVLKGFYLHTTNGEGSILYISDIYLHLTIAYHSKTEAGKDTIVNTVVPMAATKEVFMSTRFKNSGLENLVEDNSYTYLKTPAGLCTEVTLPIEEMYKRHRTESKDSLNAISVSFTKVRDTENSKYKMGTPSTLLMVRKDKMQDFFENSQINDDKTSFIATYNSGTKQYTFSQLNRLVNHIFNEIEPEIEKGETEWEKWKNDKKNENWNKVLLIPVVTTTDNEGNIIKIENDLNVNSAILQRGNTETDNNINMEVIYTQLNLR